MKDLLTPTEKEVARMNILGSGRKIIAYKRGTAMGTVQKQLERIHSKTDTGNVQELMLWYLKHYHGIDLRKVLATFVFLLMLSPEILNPHTDMVRTLRAQRSSRSSRNEYDIDDKTYCYV